MVSNLASLNLQVSQSGLFSIGSFLNRVFSQSGLFSIGSFLNRVFSQSGLFSIWSFLNRVFSQSGLFSIESFWGRHRQLDDSLVGQLTKRTVQWSCPFLLAFFCPFTPTSTLLYTNPSTRLSSFHEIPLTITNWHEKISFPQRPLSSLYEFSRIDRIWGLPRALYYKNI